MKKQIALIATAVLTIAAFAVGNTLAFFTDKGEVNNVVTMGNVAITLTEPQFKDSTDGTYSVEFMPGDVITKDPTVTNTGSNDAYVRCKVSVENVSSSSSSSEEEDTGLNSYEQEQLLEALNIDKTQWVLSSDGYYYYQKILPKAAAGQTSEVQLFNTVKIPAEWGSSDFPIDNAHFKIVISAEAIQADNFTPTKDGSGNIVAWNYSNGSAVPVESSTS